MAERILNHERAYRSAELLDRIAVTRVVVCGAGAVGSNLVHNLVRQGFRTLAVIDRDRVEEANLATQTYRRSDLGAQKAVALRNDVFRIAGVELEAVADELAERNAAKLVRGAAVVVDGFDNAASRVLVARAAEAAGIACLHVGMAADYAEVMWDGAWVAPSGAGEDVCDYPLARNVIMLAVAVASEALVSFVAGEKRRSFTITLRDMAICEHAS